MAPHPPPSYSFNPHNYYKEDSGPGWNNQEQPKLYNQSPHSRTNYSSSSSHTLTHRDSSISHNHPVHHSNIRSSAPIESHFHRRERDQEWKDSRGDDQGWNNRPTHTMNGSNPRQFIEKENREQVERRPKNLPRPHQQSSNFKDQYRMERTDNEGGGREAPPKRINSKGISSSTSSDPVNHGLSPAETREFASLIQDLWPVQRFAQEFKKYSVTDYVKIRDLIEKMKERDEKKRYGQ